MHNIYSTNTTMPHRTDS